MQIGSPGKMGYSDFRLYISLGPENPHCPLAHLGLCGSVERVLANFMLKALLVGLRQGANLVVVLRS
ncbi:hypothetical protein LF826_26935 [Citrobacter freundii]|nr:hypothetical protein [Citrobacter freundii]MCO5620327.1 hypothetical protein [Citrobacter freundii]MCO5627300.1 hypothetical protein [Citrobacter freundii]